MDQHPAPAFIENASAIAVVLVAAGRGTRMGGGLPKQWRPLGAESARVIDHTLAAFATLGLTRIVVVINPDDADHAKSLPATIVHGGNTRTASVRAALSALRDTPPDLVLIHDAARPFATPRLIADVIAAVRTHGGAAPALPVTDALWRGADGWVTGTAPREGLFRAQTPQGFRFDALLAAYDAHPGAADDDVAVFQAAGHRVWITMGDDDNLKLTQPIDFERSEKILRNRLAFNDRQ